MKKILPLLLLLIGAGAGVGAGVFLRPPPAEMTEEETLAHEKKMAEEEAEKEEEQPADREYVKLNNQFVIPVVKGSFVKALVVMSLSVEVGAGQKDAVFLREPKLRDSFLQVLFDHANMGGFEGEFTNANNLALLRKALREVAQKDMGDIVSDVLIQEIARQDY